MTQLVLHDVLPDHPALASVPRGTGRRLTCVVSTLRGEIHVSAASARGVLEARRGGELVALDVNETWVARAALEVLAAAG